MLYSNYIWAPRDHGPSGPCAKYATADMRLNLRRRQDIIPPRFLADWNAESLTADLSPFTYAYLCLTYALLMPANASVCRRMPANAGECRRIPANASECQQMRTSWRLGGSRHVTMVVFNRSTACKEITRFFKLQNVYIASAVSEIRCSNKYPMPESSLIRSFTRIRSRYRALSPRSVPSRDALAQPAPPPPPRGLAAATGPEATFHVFATTPLPSRQLPSPLRSIAAGQLPWSRFCLHEARRNWWRPTSARRWRWRRARTRSHISPPTSSS